MTTEDFLYATGRIVQGDVFVPQTKNMNGGPLLNLKGEPKVQYFLGLAVAKSDIGLAALQQTLQQIAAAGFPGGESGTPGFAWKMVDGDVAPHNTKAGFPGHVIFRFTSGFPIHVCTQGGAAQITDPEAVKRGYYARVVFQVKPNGNQQKPGLYLNHRLVELIGYGEVISSGPDAAALLGNAGAATLPTGASATPVASGAPTMPPGGMPVAGGMHRAAGAAAGTPAAGTPASGMPGAGAPTMPPGGAPAPAPGMPGAPAPASGMPGAPAPAAPDFLTPPALTAKAQGASYQQFIDQGWNDDTLRTHGYLA